MEKINNYTNGPLTIGQFKEGDYTIGPDGGDIVASGITKYEDAQLIALAPTLYERYFKMLEAFKAALPVVHEYSISGIEDREYRKYVNQMCIDIKNIIKECEL